jgi:hypothetical protein
VEDGHAVPRTVIGVLIVSLLLAASPVRAQQHVISAADLEQAMVDKAAADAASRDLVRFVLRHDMARAAAEQAPGPPAEQAGRTDGRLLDVPYVAQSVPCAREPPGCSHGGGRLGAARVDAVLDRLD